MKKIIIALCVSFVVLGGVVGTVWAYSLQAEFFIDGVDLDVGEVYHDPMIVIIVYGNVDKIETLLKPSGDFIDFDPAADFHFEFDPEDGISLVFDLEAMNSPPISGVAVLQDTFPTQVDPATFASLPFVTDFSLPIFFDPFDTVLLALESGQYLTIGIMDQDMFALQVAIDEWSGIPGNGEIPEPSTLLLLGLGLLGTFWLIQRRKKREAFKKGTSILLILIAGIWMMGIPLLSNAQTPVQKYPLFVSKTGSGTGTVNSPYIPFPSGHYDINCGSDCMEVYPQGSVITLQAIPDADSVFTGWSGGCSGTGNCEVTVNGFTHVTARFDLIVCANQAEIPLAECEALADLYNSTDGDNWDHNSGWLASTKPCTDWYGVTCGGGHVTQLSLYNNQLSGSLPESFGNLASLRYLYLYNNHLSSLPESFGELASLQDLDLSNNQLSNLPESFGSLAQLQALSLSGNQLSNLPESFGSLSQLQALKLNGTHLSSLPESFEHLSQLQYLNLSDTPLSGPLPDILTNLTLLEQFYFDGTNLCEPQDDTFRVWLAKIDDVQSTEVACTFCDYVEEIPKTECEALVALYNSTDGDDWSNNSGWLDTYTPCFFSDGGYNPDGWVGVECSSGSVTRLLLSDNHLNGNMPSSLGDLSNLQELDLANNQLSENIPVELENLVNLHGLALSNNQLSGSIPTELGNLTNLRWLNLLSNQLSGSIPSELGELINLQELKLGSNHLDGAIPAELGNLVGLQYLYLDINEFDGAIPAELGNLINLQELFLYRNELSGSIPAELGRLDDLTQLLLWENQLSGNIPPELGNLANLEVLWLGQNRLSGNIPPELGNLANLEILWLGQNRLSGNIPPELGNLANLQRLYLEDNQLSESIPPELGNLVKLNDLWLYTNPLSGSLPVNLTNLTVLEDFSFINTNLCEPQDTGFQTWLTGIFDVSSTGVACPFFDYFVDKEYYDGPCFVDGDYTGVCRDVESIPDNNGENMCWAFSSSNILDWAGWDSPPDAPALETEHAIADNYKEHWENKGGIMKYAWNWWIDGRYPPLAGTDWAQLINPDPLDPDAVVKYDQHGRHWPDYAFSKQYFSSWQGDVMAAVKDYLRRGFGVSIRLYQDENLGHALTVWGYRYYADETIAGLWVTDAADEMAALRFLPVTYEANWIDGKLYHLKWRVAEEGDLNYPDFPNMLRKYPGWLIEGVQALKPRNASFLRVRNAGTGTGVVTSDPEGISCSPDCVQSYTPGTQVTLTAAPNDGSNFVGWQGDCSGPDPCVVEVKGEKHVIAVFEAVPSPGTEMFTITVNVDAGVTVEPGFVQSVPREADATVLFIPDDQHQIIDVLVDGCSVGSVTEWTFTHVTRDHTIRIETLDKEAKFVIATKRCVDRDGNAIVCPSGNNATVLVGGQVCDSECKEIVVSLGEGTALILQVIPEEGNTFEGWTDLNGNPIEEQILYTLEDMALLPIIRCSEH